MPPKRNLLNPTVNDNEVTKKPRIEVETMVECDTTESPNNNKPKLLKTESSFSELLDCFDVDNQLVSEKPKLRNDLSTGSFAFLQFSDDDDDIGGGNDKEEEYIETFSKNFQNEFTVLTPKDISLRQNNLIEKVSELTCLSRANCRKLLTHFNWDRRKLEEEYFEDPDKLYLKCGILIIDEDENNDNNNNKNNNEEEITCSICYEDFTPTNPLSCNHSFCLSCLSEYIRTHISENMGLLSIQCPDRNCSIVIDDDVVIEILENYQSFCEPNSADAKTNSNTIDRFKKNLAESYVVDNDLIKWCIQPNCYNAIEVDLKNCLYVKCLCGGEFCYACEQPPHRPATCEMVKKWTAKRSTDEMDAAFISGFTKDCPKCSSPIIKDGGCQYIRCGKCKHGFCWICLGAFDHVKHACNAYVPIGDPESDRAQYAKFMFFLKRFETHEQSIKLESKLIDLAIKTRNELQNQGLSYNEANCVNDAVDAIKDSRIILKNSYVYGYFLPKNVSKPIFEDLQATLEFSVETLSGLLESKDTPVDRIKIINLTKIVLTQKTNMLSSINNIVSHLKDTKEDYTKYGADALPKKYDGWIY